LNIKLDKFTNVLIHLDRKININLPERALTQEENL